MKTIRLRRAWRGAEKADIDELVFEDGLNQIVGPPNSGKTKWLRTIDYCLGDRGTAADALSEDLAKQQRSIGTVLRIGDAEWVIERRPNDPGLRTKILVNETALTPGDFSAVLLDELQIPRFTFSRGQHEIELSWRMLMANIYRREKGWSDLAQGQWQGDQHASLLAFLGLGRFVAFQQSAEIADLRSELRELEARRRHFATMLQHVAYEVLTLEEIAIGVTSASLEQARARLRSERAALEERRDTLSRGDEWSTESRFVVLLEELAAARRELKARTMRVQESATRHSELGVYAREVDAERSRWARAQVAGELLTEARVQQCPVCDRPVEPPPDSATCFLCRRPYPASSEDEAGRRVEFERAQLDEESREAAELLAEARRETETVERAAIQSKSEVQRLESLIEPLQRASTAAFSGELREIEQQIGRTNQLIEQIERLEGLQNERDRIDEERTRVQTRIAELDSQAQTLTGQSPFARAASRLEDGINSYLNVIGSARWTKPLVRVRVRERDFEFFVGEETWSAALGATLTCYFVAAYHYGLLSLCQETDTAYPGFVILDFPATLATLPIGAENYIVEPFVALAAKHGMPPVQVIAAGRALNIANVPANRLG